MRGDFQTTIFIPYLLFLRQTIPQAISRNATRNIKTPTGKTAAIRMPSPNASAQMPMMNPPQFHPLIQDPPLFQYMGAEKAECLRTPLFLFFHGPLFQILQLIVQPDVAAVAAGVDIPIPHCLQNAAALLLGVAAPYEAALVHIGG